jgi:hypothetical protein
MAAWQQSGSMHAGFHGSTILKIDETLPVANPHLGDATFPGWYTVLRNGWGSRNETAVWLVDGDFYRDHAHEDNGTVVIYALGAPLSIDWGSMYSPRSPGAFMHSLAVPESALPFAWDTAATHLEQIGFRWQHAAAQAFESFPASAYVCATYETKGATWTRSVYSIHPDESNPIIAIRDNFDGPDAATPKILTLNLVDTPPEPGSPPRPLARSTRVCGPVAHQLGPLHLHFRARPDRHPKLVAPLASQPRTKRIRQGQRPPLRRAAIHPPPPHNRRLDLASAALAQRPPARSLRA